MPRRDPIAPGVLCQGNSVRADNATRPAGRGEPPATGARASLFRDDGRRTAIHSNQRGLPLCAGYAGTPALPGVRSCAKRHER
jgi:hypothetical protein